MSLGAGGLGCDRQTKSRSHNLNLLLPPKQPVIRELILIATTSEANERTT